MDCDLARTLTTFARPGATELDAADVAALEAHLADCMTCRTQSRRERDLDDRLARTMQSVEIPSDGRARLDRRLISERGIWRRRWAYRIGAFALLSGLLWYLFPARTLDVETIANDAYNLVGNRDGVDEWLRKRNSRFGFPARMNPRHLVGCELRDFHGTRAPVLTFVRHNAIARVAVVSANQFRNLPELRDGRVAENSVCTVLIFHDPDLRDVVFVVEVINGPVELFYNEGEASVT